MEGSSLELRVASEANDEAPERALAPAVHSGRRTSLLQAVGPPGGAPQLHGHRVPVSQYLAFCIWILLLLAQYALIRAVCPLGVPYDCAEHHDHVRLVEDIHYLLFTGTVLAMLAGVHWPDRFQYIFRMQRPKPRGLLFVATVGVSGVVWGALGLVPGFKDFTLTGVSAAYAGPFAAVVVGAVLLVAWHLWIAFKHNSRAGFLAYVLTRLVLLVLYFGYLLVKLENVGDVNFHLHHYAVAFLAGSLAEFNHPFSLLLLACGTGIFVQGLSAYGADAIVSHKMYRLHFPDSSGHQLVSPPVSWEAVEFFRHHCHLHEGG